MSLSPRDALEIDALRTDRYLESLLAGQPGQDGDREADGGPDSTVRYAVVRLERDLVRVHPSFRFEERLAGRLAEVAASLRLPAAAGGGGDTVVPIGPVGGAGSPAFPASLLDPLGDPDGETAIHVPRPVLIGGAITSAALSIAAYLAWRRARAPLSPMARAVRAARLTRMGLLNPGAAPWRRAD
jgi:hypothetical protein